MEYEEKKKKGNLPFVKTWMNLEGIIKLSETETKKILNALTYMQIKKR